MPDSWRRYIESERKENDLRRSENSLLRQSAIRQSQSSLWTFRETFFRMSHSHPSASYHKAEMDHLQEKTGTRYRIARAEPRNHAKSTRAAEYAIWCAATGRKKFIIYIGATQTLATMFLETVAHELQTNPLLLSVYGPLIASIVRAKGAAAGKNTRQDIILTNGCRIHCYSRGMKIRGIKHRHYRPDLAILDDIEDDEHVQSKRQRIKTENWLNKAVLPAMDAATGDVLYIGTILHSYSLLSTVIRNKAWDAKVYQAIKPDGLLLWPEKITSKFLAEERDRMGPTAFAQEYLNQSRDDSSIVFRLDWIKYWQGDVPKNRQLVIAVDPAIRTQDHNDETAIIVLAKDQKTHKLILCDVIARRAEAHTICQEILRLYRQWKPNRIILETVAFQELYKSELERIAREEGLYLPTQGVEHHRDKGIRIRRLEPIFARGDILLAKPLPEFEEQYSMWPEVEHDDMLDALEMAVEGIETQSHGAWSL